ncbi:MAG: hypothetical protein LUD48_06090 [Prevotella sp.]|nr:hypothetical protein [Prevotella sp.]
MRFHRFVIISILIVAMNAMEMSAREVRDTIYTTSGDRIILTYDISYSGTQTILRFTGQQKKLGKTNAGKYKDLSKVAVMFFDRTGNYSDDVDIQNMEPEAFMVPSGVEYKGSREGYFLVQSSPVLYFTVNNKEAIMRIPVYLAQKPKKGKYVLFAKSSELKIPLSSKKVGGSGQSRSKTIQETITSQSEIESDNTVIIKVLESIKAAKAMIVEADRLPFSDNLLDEVGYLRQKRREITDEAVVDEISEVLNSYEEKKRILEEKEDAAQEELQRAEELRAEKEAAALKAENDSIEAAQQEAKEKDKKRNIWLIIIGVILAILVFIGNQLFQGFRNRRNQRNMMNMQQSIANRAEAEAKRRANNAMRQQQHRIEVSARKKVSKAKKNSPTIKVNGKTKNPSI